MGNTERATATLPETVVGGIDRQAPNPEPFRAGSYSARTRPPEPSPIAGVHRPHACSPELAKTCFDEWSSRPADDAADPSDGSAGRWGSPDQRQGLDRKRKVTWLRPERKRNARAPSASTSAPAHEPASTIASAAACRSVRPQQTVVLQRRAQHHGPAAIVGPVNGGAIEIVAPRRTRPGADADVDQRARRSAVPSTVLAAGSRTGGALASCGSTSSRAPPADCAAATPAPARNAATPNAAVHRTACLAARTDHSLPRRPPTLRPPERRGETARSIRIMIVGGRGNRKTPSRNSGECATHRADLPAGVSPAWGARPSPAPRGPRSCPRRSPPGRRT